LIFVVLLSACATVGIDSGDVRPLGPQPFDKALIDYATGDLDQAQAGVLAALEANPLDVRATDLLRAILQEKGLIDEFKPAADAAIPEFTPSSPAEMVQLIRGRNPAVREAVFGVIQARAQLREANVDVGPEVSVLTRFYPLGILARLSQSLYGGWWERKAKMHEAEAAIVEALGKYGRSVETVTKDSLLAYLDAVDARENLNLLEREGSLLEQQHNQSLMLVRHGRSLPREPLVTRSEIGALNRDQARARQQLATATARLNALMNRAPTAPVEIVSRGFSWHPSPNLDEALTTAFVNRFELDEAKARIKTAEAQKALQQTRDPKIDVYGTYGDSDEKNEGSFLKGFSVGMVTRFPLAIFPLKKARADQRDAFIRQLELRSEQVRNEIAVEVVDAYHGWDTAQSEFNEKRAELALANEDRRIAVTERAEEVDTDPLAWNRAQVEYVRAERAVLDGNFGLQRSLIELSSTVGADINEITFLSADLTARRSAAMLVGDIGSGRRGLWVWRKEFLRSPDETAFFVDLLRVRKIGVVFLYVTGEDLIARADSIGRFVELAGQNRIAVHALNGEHEWLLGRQSAAVAYAAQVAQYNAAIPEKRRFAALHIDVEPHALQGWANPERKEELLFSYIGLLDGLKASREQLPLVVDIPLWFADREVDGIKLNEVVMRRADGVVYMAYGTALPRRARFFEQISRQAMENSSQFWVGVSADRKDLCPSPLPETLEADMASIESTMDPAPEFRGVAIHDYERYRNLLLGLERPGARGSRTGCLHAGDVPGGRG